ncbi:MAG: short-chain dehydrogenase [Burkholderiales bacterium PBB1]|nr:MAG: short-chain dehydrogenase [Burkholderiales bacterium PBB1]
MSLNPRISDWHGRVVWLVGASSGIGLATAQLLHARGAKVIVSARNAAALAAFEAAHADSLGIPLDATDREAMARAVQRIVARFGRLDMALYCAGHYAALRATAFDLDQMLQHDKVNYVGALYMLDAVLPVLLRQKSGHISLVASVAGYRGLPNALAYGPTKAALINLAQTLYLDLQPQGVGVSVICPGFVETPLTAQNEFKMPALIQPEEAAQEMLAGWAAGEFEIHFPKRFTRFLKALSHLGDGLYFRAIRRVTGL